MTKTIRAHQVQAAADKMFGSKLAKLKQEINGLTSRLRTLENKVGVLPIEDATIIEEGAVLNKKKELPNASKSSR